MAEAMLAGIASAPDDDVFGGPIRPRLEGGGPRSCGREPRRSARSTSDRPIATYRWSGARTWRFAGAPLS